MIQFALPFLWPADETTRDFCITPANAAAVAHLDRPGLWPVRATLLTGPRKSGRSLLGRIFAAKTGGRLIDDADRQPEEMLFHAWNAAQAERRPLLLIGDAPPPGWPIALADLRSRIAATPHVAIGQPDGALIATLLEKLLGARGLAAAPGLILYLERRIERSYVGIHRVVDALDAASLARRSGITIPTARAALAEMGVIDDSHDSR